MLLLAGHWTLHLFNLTRLITGKKSTTASPIRLPGMMHGALYALRARRYASGEIRLQNLKDSGGLNLENPST